MIYRVLFLFSFMLLFVLQIGVWNSNTGLNLTDNSKESSTNVTDSMANRTLIVTTILVREQKKIIKPWSGTNENRM